MVYIYLFSHSILVSLLPLPPPPAGLSIVGNVLVLIMAYRRSSSMKPPEMLSINLAVIDLGAAISMYPLAAVSAWNHHWLGGDATCLYYGLAGFFFGTASIMNLTVMAVVRYVVTANSLSPGEQSVVYFLYD